MEIIKENEDICVKSEDVKKVLEKEGINPESLKALSGEQLSEKDLEEIVGGLNTKKLKNLAVKGLQYGAYVLAIAGTAYAATDIAVNRGDSLAGKGINKAKGLFGSSD